MFRQVPGKWDVTPAGKKLFGLTLRSIHNMVERERIGNNSAYGSVHVVDIPGFAPGAFVIKHMEINTQQMGNIFVKEVTVGSNPELHKQSVGPVIVARTGEVVKRNGRHFGSYIMTSFTRGDLRLRSVSLHKYLQSAQCPRKNSPVVRMLKETLVNFYKITQGYHGDLHAGNIAVVVDTVTNNIVWVYVFDYGAHTKFSKYNANTVQQCNTISEIFDVVNASFTRNFILARNKEHHVRFGRIIYPENNQPYRSNAEILRNYSKHLYNKIATPRGVVNSRTSNSNASSVYTTPKSRFNNNLRNSN